MDGKGQALTNDQLDKYRDSLLFPTRMGIRITSHSPALQRKDLLCPSITYQALAGIRTPRALQTGHSSPPLLLLDMTDESGTKTT